MDEKGRSPLITDILIVQTKAARKDENMDDDQVSPSIFITQTPYDEKNI